MVMQMGVDVGRSHVGRVGDVGDKDLLDPFGWMPAVSGVGGCGAEERRGGVVDGVEKGIMGIEVAGDGGREGSVGMSARNVGMDDVGAVLRKQGLESWHMDGGRGREKVVFRT